MQSFYDTTGMDLVVRELCYNGTILQRNYREMTITWSFSNNSFVKFHGKIFFGSYIMTMIYPNLWYNKVYYKGTALYFDLILYVPVSNFSVMSGRVFLGWTSTKLSKDKCVMIKDTTQWHIWGLMRPRSLETSNLPLSHCAPCPVLWKWKY